MTNISNEHLDYHKTYAEYKAAKKRLFDYVQTWKGPDRQIFLPSAQQDVQSWVEQYGSDLVTFYGIEKGAIYATAIELGKESTTFTLCTATQQVPCVIPMVGTFNVCNALLAISMAQALGVTVEDAVKSLAHFPGVSGRLQHYHLK
ncbi:MAG: hypothetical protein H6765_06950 [Candidatus Peribacteria bacterium]|nr:MAG: hypothetical protein H6765_06950 [Candidatus Peribacteria bacterium]